MCVEGGEVKSAKFHSSNNRIYGSFDAKSTLKNGQPLQISMKRDLQVVLHYLLLQTEFRPQKLWGFFSTAFPKLDFSGVPGFTKQTITSFLPHLCRHFFERLSHVAH